MKKFHKIFISLFIIVLILIMFYFMNKDIININTLRNLILDSGYFAPLIYIIAFSLVPLTFFPDSLLAILGGTLFGLSRGFLYTSIGALIGGSISFFISRILGQSFVEKLENDKLKNIQNLLKDNGFLMILLLRLIPLFPFDLISYGAGLTKISYKDFVLGTLIGTIPGILVFVNLGAQWISFNKESIYLSVSLLILFIIVSLFLKKIYINKHLSKEN
ncbi:TVP38/TMEM64 family protein [Clostridium sp. LIBA-8841]|uniref:TVP38/TMEM64 family protein n=1 Tax=Clostridium sp. LIBA-8841 TaxID=2987530 RepID=UPI002AC3B8E8|nr:TVP38/TMEM64 family protein [Clostridium sp. LIBA-8841]MDZ5252538.1 TVP38/TMEM64 family protein [Clostridium sp. LIBA-8841]